MRRIFAVAFALMLGWVTFEVYSIFGKADVKLNVRGKAAVADASEPTTATPAEPNVAVTLSEEILEGFPASINIVDGSTSHTAQYTGQMRRVKPILILPINVYDIASYVVEPKPGETLQLLDGLLVDGPAKVYMLRFLNSIPGKKISDDIYQEINNTFTDVDVERLESSIHGFVQQFRGGSKRGDIVYIVWLPGGRIYSGFNTPSELQLIGHDVPFARAIWRIWAGPQFGDNRLNLVSRYAEGTTK